MKKISLTQTREQVITRILDAPRSLVFKLLSDPNHIEKWYGPKGFTNKVTKLDFRVAGEWRYIMQAPNGSRYKSKAIYQEIIENEKIAYLEKEDSRNRPVQVTLTFEDQGKAQTKLTLKMTVSVDDWDEKMFLGASQGYNQAFDRLEDYIASLKQNKK